MRRILFAVLGLSLLCSPGLVQSTPQPASNQLSGLTKAQMLQANCLFILGGRTQPPEDVFVQAVLRTGIKLVMLDYSLWDGPYGRRVVPRLEAAGITIWYHLLPPHFDRRDVQWLSVTLSKLRGKRAIFCDGNEFFGGNKPSVDWDDSLFRLYRQAARSAVGPDGVVGASCWMRESESLDVLGYWEAHERDTLPGQTANRIMTSQLLKQKHPTYRCEVGWIGYLCNDNSGWVIPEQPNDIPDLWMAAHRAGLPITWRTTCSRLVEREADLIAASERLHQVLLTYK